jgi:hypothetical protein
VDNVRVHPLPGFDLLKTLGSPLACAACLCLGNGACLGAGKIYACRACDAACHVITDMAAVPPESPVDVVEIEFAVGICGQACLDVLGNIELEWPPQSPVHEECLRVSLAQCFDGALKVIAVYHGHRFVLPVCR